MLETTIDELDGGSMYSVQIQSNTKTPINLIVSTVKTTQTLNQSKLCLVSCHKLDLISSPGGKPCFSFSSYLPLSHLISSYLTILSTPEPSAPAECTARRETASRIVVSWNEPENPHGKILFYTIYYSNRWNPADGPYVHNVTDAQTTSVSGLFILFGSPSSLNHTILCTAQF